LESNQNAIFIRTGMEVARSLFPEKMEMYDMPPAGYTNATDQDF
jgi:hypothetical protein